MSIANACIITKDSNNDHSKICVWCCNYFKETKITVTVVSGILYINTLSWGPWHASVGYSLRPTRTSSLSMMPCVFLIVIKYCLTRFGESGVLLLQILNLSLLSDHRHFPVLMRECREWKNKAEELTKELEEERKRLRSLEVEREFDNVTEEEASQLVDAAPQ